MVTLGLVLAAITGVVIWQTHHLLTRGWIVALVAVVWVGSTAILRARQDTLGIEGAIVDWWSIPHLMSGVMLGIVGVPLLFIVGIAVAWEIIELTSHIDEYRLNRVADLALAISGWFLVNLCASGSFDLV
ncbi:MAG TPA: hypothetical protein VGM90_41530 [Kofleriaceae bacterium]|jgi:hypothetical protein